MVPVAAARGACLNSDRRRGPVQTDDIPEGYSYELTSSTFVNHIGRLFTRDAVAADGTVQRWVAMRIEEHQVNTWNFAHGSLITAMAEIATARVGYDPDGPPCVAIDLTVQFIGAPKLGELLEAYGTITKRTRSLVFTQAHGMVAGKPMFMATSIQKIVES